MRLFLAALPLASVLAISAPSLAQPAAQAPADGQWTLRLSCAESALDAQGRRLPSFTANIRVAVAGGQISRELRYARPNNQSVNVTEIWGGNIAGGNFTINARGEDTAGGRWSYSFSGRVLRAELLSGQGEQFREPSRAVNRICRVDLAPAGQAENIFAEADRRRQQEEDRRAQEPEAERRRQAEQQLAAEEQRRRQQQQQREAATQRAAEEQRQREVAATRAGAAPPSNEIWIYYQNDRSGIVENIERSILTISCQTSRYEPEAPSLQLHIRGLAPSGRQIYRFNVGGEIHNLNMQNGFLLGDNAINRQAIARLTTSIMQTNAPMIMVSGPQHTTSFSTSNAREALRGRGGGSIVDSCGQQHSERRRVADDPQRAPTGQRPLDVAPSRAPIEGLGLSTNDVRRQILDELRRQRCTLTEFRSVYEGPLGADATNVIVVQYAYESCGGGGNNNVSTFGVFTQNSGRIGRINIAENVRNLPDVVDLVRVQEGKIIVQGLTYAPSDARCCPSLRRQAELGLRGGRLELVGANRNSEASPLGTLANARQLIANFQGHQVPFWLRSEDGRRPLRIVLLLQGERAWVNVGGANVQVPVNTTGPVSGRYTYNFRVNDTEYRLTTIADRPLRMSQGFAIHPYRISIMQNGTVSTLDLLAEIDPGGG